MLLDFTNPTPIAVLTVLAICVGQSQSKPELSISPNPAIADEEVVFTCRNLDEGIASVASANYHLIRGGNTLYNVVGKCDDSMDPKVEKNDLIGASFEFGCAQTKIKVPRATREALAGEFKCRIVTVDPNTLMSSSLETPNSIQLSVGDRTPPVKEFTMKSQMTKKAVINGTKITAGDKVNVTCSTNRSDPLPGFEVDVTGQETRRNRTAASKEVFFIVDVPRIPRVELKCSVFNGFGERKSKTLLLLPQYAADPNSIVIPTELVVQTADEVTVCEVANNPPVQLKLDGVDASLLQAGYPKYTAANGKSTVVVKFAKAAQSLQTLEVTCSLPGGGKKAGAITLSVAETSRIADSSTSTAVTSSSTSEATPKSAMMMIGIVVACLIVFLLVVAGLAYICKRRDANKASSGDPNYKTVNQHDTETPQPMYDSAPTYRTIKVDVGDGCGSGAQPGA